jgi:hypothetical protein
MSWASDAVIAAAVTAAAGGATAAAVCAGSARLSRLRGDDPEKEDHDMRAWERETGGPDR